MTADDRVGLMPTTELREGKLKCRRGVVVHALVQTVSQVWQAGPLRVWLEERDGETWLVVKAPWLVLAHWGADVGFDCEAVLDWARTQQLRWELPLTSGVDGFLVELVDVIADVRRAAGTVQMCFEDLEDGGD